jgi:hypothetical protein
MPEANGNSDAGEEEPDLERLPSPKSDLERSLDTRMSEYLVSERPAPLPAADDKMRKYKDFPVNEKILNFMTETVIVIDYSFQNILNNIKSVQARCRSASIDRLLNTNIGSNPVTGIENYFNDLTSISLECDYVCASDLSTIYKWVSYNDLFDRPPKAPRERKIPTVRNLERDILYYDQNAILVSPDGKGRG